MTCGFKMAICGESCITGLGDGLGLWMESIEKRCEVPRMIDPELFRDHVDPVNSGVRELNRVQKISAIAFSRAIINAGISVLELPQKRIAILFGNTYGVEEFKTGFYRVFSTSAHDLTSPVLFPFTTCNSISAYLSIMYGIEGINITYSSGATSASEALLAANDILSLGKADTVVVIGESFFYDSLDVEFVRCGFKNECCAAIVLMGEKDAKKSGKNIHAYIENIEHGFLGKKTIYDVIPPKAPACRILNHGMSFGTDANGEDGGAVSNQGGIRLISLERIFGNTFSASGVLGLILGEFWLKYEKPALLGERPSNYEEVFFMNIDSCGGYVGTTISGKK